ncbi:MAG: aminotransferase class I/II-fold pyridoxal phosphate-dependent enzyme [Ignavibacteria bacterium]|nr:aminotransferase class I/II-fold pyridoxal phosphate-dependent enzyme [Ignavibacteria bacterium]
MDDLLFSQFIGPKGENLSLLKTFIEKILSEQKLWREDYFACDPSLYQKKDYNSEKLTIEFEKFLERSKKHFPFFHPRYAAQMAKDPSIPTILGYLTFMLSNPNNHAYEGGPVTTEMEMEVVDLLLKMVEYKTGWGHLTSGGSLANMEALWAARDYYKKGTVYFSEVSHYSWKRICKILNIDSFKEIPVDINFRMDCTKLEDELKKSEAMMVVANLGSTGTGSVDNIEEILELKKKYNFHLHIDAAYGGFFRSIILDENYNHSSQKTPLSGHTEKQLQLLSESDSITIDPHKQGSVSYGAGAVLYKNEELRDIILNTAPYTYHKLDKPNIGMFSLEGSRSGATAAACYLTYKVIPPNNSGIGELLSQTILASQKFYQMIGQSENYDNLNFPDLDINCFFRRSYGKNISEVNERTLAIYHLLSVEAENPEFILSKFVLSPEITKTVLPEYENPKNESLIALRAVFMKHWYTADDFYYLKKLIDVLELKAKL